MFQEEKVKKRNQRDQDIDKQFNDIYKIKFLPEIYQKENISNTFETFFTLIRRKNSINPATILLKNLIDSFNLRNDLYDEGMTLIGCISLFTQENFNAVMDLISPYLIKGLSSTDSPSICKTSILCLSDIIRGLEAQNKYVNVYSIYKIKFK